ncbi:DUF4232 domain-containing protein [Actinomycetospora sp. C-140]
MTPGSTTTVALPPTSRTCTIAITLGPGEGAMGSQYQPVIFTNSASTPCQLTGGAHAELVDADGAVVGTSSPIDGGTTRLAPREAVTSTMRSTPTYAFDEDRCSPRPVAGLRVTPPADAASTMLPSPVGATACTGINRNTPTFTALPVAGEGP